MNNDDLVDEYVSTGMTVAQMAKKHGCSAGKMYNVLLSLGCPFTKKRRKPFSEEERKARSIRSKGRKLSPEQRAAISERNSCNFNGLNGYGHTKKHNGGYVLAYVPKHPHSHTDGYVMLHTVIMERNIGRYLSSDEVVHHKNRNRSDNRIENLQLMNKKDHMAMHMKERYAIRKEC